MTTASSRGISALRLWTPAASAVAVLVGCRVLLGWTFDITPLKLVLRDQNGAEDLPAELAASEAPPRRALAAAPGGRPGEEVGTR